MSAPTHKHTFRKRDEELDRYINLKLAALGQPVSRSTAGCGLSGNRRTAAAQLLPEGPAAGQPAVPSDSRIQDFLDAYLSDVCPQGAARLPGQHLRARPRGMARVMSLPVTRTPSRRRI